MSDNEIFRPESFFWNLKSTGIKPRKARQMVL